MVKDILQSKEMTLSYEFFPPKTLASQKVLFETIDALASSPADFASVTFGAGGAMSDKTIDWVKYIKEYSHFEPLMHITCVGFSRAKVDDILSKLEENNIYNIFALRGDIPQGVEISSNDFLHASDLVSYIKSKSSKFSIGVAGYPEKHPEAPSLEEDIRMLKLKVAAGADFITTQLFFDNSFFYKFSELLGGVAPILAGIMPITQFSQIERFQKLCGSHIPSSLISQMQGRSEEDVHKIGVEFACKQCEDLMKNGVKGLHFYTLNKSSATKEIIENLGLV